MTTNAAMKTKWSRHLTLSNVIAYHLTQFQNCLMISGCVSPLFIALILSIHLRHNYAVKSQDIYFLARGCEMNITGSRVMSIMDRKYYQPVKWNLKFQPRFQVTVISRGQWTMSLRLGYPDRSSLRCEKYHCACVLPYLFLLPILSRLSGFLLQRWCDKVASSVAATTYWSPDNLVMSFVWIGCFYFQKKGSLVCHKASPHSVRKQFWAC